jgi:cytochrome c
MKPNWAIMLFVMTAAMLMALPASAQDVVAGQRVYQQICQGCHSAAPGKDYIGPSLFGVVGRHVGREPGYHYSKADLAANLVFDTETLDRYISSPQGVIPGTAMSYNGLKEPKKRADLVAFLATLH